MTQRDYAEAWGWVHYMLQTSDETADVLLRYLASLESARTPPRMLPLLEVTEPSYFSDVQAHVDRMQNSSVAVDGR